jgi:hypothetical protein
MSPHCVALTPFDCFRRHRGETTWRRQGDAVDLLNRLLPTLTWPNVNRRKKSEDDVSALAERKTMSHIAPTPSLHMTGSCFRSSGINRHWPHQA